MSERFITLAPVKCLQDRNSWCESSSVAAYVDNCHPWSRFINTYFYNISINLLNLHNLIFYPLEVVPNCRHLQSHVVRAYLHNAHFLNRNICQFG